jgi:hypothetical protein
MTAKKKPKLCTIVFALGADGWDARVVGVPECRAHDRSLQKVRVRMGDAMRKHRLPGRAPVEERFELRGLDEPVKRALAARENASRAVQKAHAETKSAVDRLVKAGVTLRDIGLLLGMSLQRVQQVSVQAEDARTIGWLPRGA